jgi:hypothetical protein
MTTRRDRERAVRSPELSRVLDLKAGIPQPVLGLRVIGRDDGGVAEHGSGTALGEDQVDLGAIALQPADRVPERLGRVDLLEAKQASELDRAIGLVRRHPRET